MATTGYQAGTESNQVLLSYAPEATYGALPAVQFQAIRMTSESLSGTKTRTRPAELNTTGEVSAAITTQEQAAGAVNFALSYGTYDDWLASLLRSTWQAPQAIAGVAGDLTLTSGTNVLSSTTAGKFANLAVGQWIRTLGFTNAANNGISRIITYTDAQHLVLSAPVVPFVTETPAGAAGQVRASTIKNGTTFSSLYVQKNFGAGLYLRYPGLFVSAATLQGGVGQFLSGSFTTMAISESSATTDASTGSVLAAPTGKVHDPIGGFKGVFLNESPISAIVDSFTLNPASTGAAQQFGMGSASAQGQLVGLMEVKGTLKAYFKDFTLYSRFKSEAGGALEFITEDANGNAYVVTLPNATIMNPAIVAGNQNTAVMATFNIEGNPATGGGTIQIDRLPAV